MTQNCIQYYNGCVNFDPESFGWEKPCVVEIGLPLKCGSMKLDAKRKPAPVQRIQTQTSPVPKSTRLNGNTVVKKVKALCGLGFKNGGAKASHERFCPVCITAARKAKKEEKK